MSSRDGEAGGAGDDARHDAYAYVGAFFDALVECGVEHVCASPGSRSTPLVVSAARTRGLAVVPIVDERSAGFFALGLARQSERPVALVCTSGTAATNYLPAVTESHYARIPLIVLTADRPPELREWGAGQTIDQHGLYGTAVRRYVEMPIATSDPGLLRHARSLASRAVADATGSPAGPVHLNWPFREPLEPLSVSATATATVEAVADAAPRRVRVVGARAEPHAEDVATLAALVRERRRGLVACGPMPPDPDRDQAIVDLARRAGWPILADPLSGLRRGAHARGAPIVAHSELWLRDETLAAELAPDVVLRFGDSPTSKTFRLWLEAHPPEALALIDPGGGFADPSHLATDVVRADPTAVARAVTAASGDEDVDATWRDRILGADRRAAAAVSDPRTDQDGLDEPAVVRALASRLPAGATLFVSSSMPVRDVDAFLPVDERPLRVLGNRGANGIDGVTSSALGAAFSGRGPVVLLTGDLALLHDLGGLLTARTEGIPLVVVVLNNDGGGIFSFLPIAAQGPDVEFERLFRTPHGVDLAHAAALFDLGFTRVTSEAALGDVLEKLLDGTLDRCHLVEVPVDRDANVRSFRALAARAAEAAVSGAGS